MGAPVLFEELEGVSVETLAVLHSFGFTQATPVQEATIPLFCGNKDVAVDAATGSGKTLAFLVPIVERLRKQKSEAKTNEVQAMVISPTRELAQQTFKVAQSLVATLDNCAVCLLVGGTDVSNDLDLLAKGANIMIGTPGRIDDVMRRVQTLSYKAFEVLVLDEADRLLEMGFQRQLDAIMTALPKQRRTGLFSATQTEAVEALVRAGLRNPFRVNVAVTARDGAASTQKTPSTLHIEYLFAENSAKVGQALAFLRAHADQKVIVYFLTCASVDYFSQLLPQLPGGDAVSFLSLHGHMKQRKRAEVLQEFADATSGALLCTDLAARGLDIPHVHWILQFDPPQDPSAFVHRCGRTARMGRSGNALAFLLPHEDAYVDLLAQRRIPLTQRDPEVDALDMSAEARRLSETDRDLMEKGTKAFVSYMRGYKEHQCKFIFRVADLDVASLGSMFGLLRLPAMQEVRKNRVAMKTFVLSEVDPADVPYLDAAREKQRRKTLARKLAAGTDAASMKAKRVREREVKAEAAATEAATKKLPGAKRQLLVQRQERCDMADDYRLLRKLKKGKLSEAEFELEIGYTAAHTAKGAAGKDEVDDGPTASDDDDAGMHGDDALRERAQAPNGAASSKQGGAAAGAGRKQQGAGQSGDGAQPGTSGSGDDGERGAKQRKKGGEARAAAAGDGSSRTVRKRKAQRMAGGEMGPDGDQGGPTKRACSASSGAAGDVGSTAEPAAAAPAVPGDASAVALLKRKLKKARLKANKKLRPVTTA